MSKQTEFNSPDEKFTALGNMTQSVEQRFIELGELFSDVKCAKLYRFKGYEKFKDFVESEYNFGAGLANKLVAVYELYIQEMDMDEGTAREIGFDRLNMVRPLITKADWKLREEWIAKAGEMPIKDLREHIKETKKAEKGEDLDMKQVLIDQMKERVMTYFNCNWAEATFKLALLITGVSQEQMDEIKKMIRTQQANFERELSKGGDNG